MNSAGIVKIVPDASDELALPIVCAMLASRIVPLRAEQPEDGDRQHRDRDRRRDGQPGLEPEVGVRGAEQHAEDEAAGHGLDRELGDGRLPGPWHAARRSLHDEPSCVTATVRPCRGNGSRTRSSPSPSHSTSSTASTTPRTRSRPSSRRACMKPQWAVAWAAFFNFIAFLFFGLKVATTIGKGVVEPDSVTIPVVTAGLVGRDRVEHHHLVRRHSVELVARARRRLRRRRGRRTRASARSSFRGDPEDRRLHPRRAVDGDGGRLRCSWSRRTGSSANAAVSRVGGLFRKLQFVSAAAYSLGHGGNDAQKTMGIILAVLIADGSLAKTSEIPLWVVLSCHAAMGLGTLMGGWRIVKTMGQKICALQPVHGFAAETGGALCLFGATALGIPVSTTHTITGAIVGVGSTRGARAVKLGRRRPRRLGLDPHDPGVGADRRGRVRDLHAPRLGVTSAYACRMTIDSITFPTSAQRSIASSRSA